MNDVLLFALLGAATGALYALSALGIVLTYRGSGVINFASGAIGMVGAFCFWELADLSGWPPAIAMILAIGLAGLLGWLTHLLMTPLKQASNLVRIVVTLSILVVLEGIFGLKWNIADSFPVNPLLPTGPFDFFGLSVGRDRLLLIVICIVLTAVLAAVYRHTRFGLATSAVAENKDALATLGWSPQAVAGANWALGGALSGLAAILLVPIEGLSVGLSTQLLLPALAAAVVGSLNSFWLTLAGGMLIGVLQSEITLKASSIQGLGDAIPFAAIIIIIVVRGRSLPVRSFVAERLPRVTSGDIHWRKLCFGFVVAVAMIGFVLSPGWVNACIATITGTILLLSIVVVTGFAGQISLAQSAIAGIGGLFAAQLIAHGVPDVLAILIAVGGVLPVGLLVGSAALRARGMGLAIATLAFGECIISLVLSNQNFDGGVTGAGVNVGTFNLFGLDIDGVNHPHRFGVFALIVLILTMLGLLNIRRGRSGRRLLAVRANERAAAALGISVYGSKVSAFCYGAVIAALAGVIVAVQFPAAIFSNYTAFTSIQDVSYAVLGGVGYVTGALVGGQGQPGGVGTQIFSFLSENIDQYIAIFFGILTLFVIVRAPNGLIELQVAQNRLLKERFLSLLHRLGAPLRTKHKEPLPPLRNLVVVPSPDREPIELIASDLVVTFGGVRAVDGVSFAVRSGEVLGVIGPNGAGKTTLIDAVTGFAPLRSGAVSLSGTDVTRLGVRQRARIGLSRSFQSLELFEDMTVLENLLAACDDRSPEFWVTDVFYPRRPTLSSAARSAITQFGLEEELSRYPGELSYGKRRLLAIARAIAANPRVLLLDEPAAGLDQREREEVVGVVRRLATEWGFAVFLIEHDVPLVAAASDYMLALDYGREIASGPPELVRSAPSVLASYVGEEVPDHASPREVEVSELIERSAGRQ